MTDLSEVTRIGVRRIISNRTSVMASLNISRSTEDLGRTDVNDHTIRTIFYLLPANSLTTETQQWGWGRGAGRPSVLAE